MSPVRLLLADDHAVVRAGIRKTVEEVPNLKIVAEAGNGPEIFAALARETLDCLLIDVSMPDFEPISAIKQIRVQFPEIKILVISAHDDNIYVQGLLAAGVNGYHLKDQPLEDLKLAVQRVLDGERWISSPLISKLISPSASIETASPLTARQRDLLRLLQEGHDNQSIANLMNLSVKTVENHLTRLYRQLNVQSRLEAVNYALRYPHVLGIQGKEAASSDELLETELNNFVSVLVVDDNARYRAQLQRMIGRLCPRAAIYEAENIATALRLAQQVKPQLALIDVVLSDEDGISCTRRVKAACPQTHIILISAYPDREFHRLGLEAGAVAFLDKKDLDLQTLRLVINDVID
jgi:DNA-binding NarL/FixJ family response regulator